MKEICLKPETLAFLKKRAKVCVYCKFIARAAEGNVLRPFDLGQYSGADIDVETQKGHLMLEMGKGGE